MKFLIIATQRTGTTLLTTLLNSHPQITCYAEEGIDFISRLEDNQGSNLKYNQIPSNYDLGEYKIIHLIRKDLLALSLSKVINKHKKKYGRPSHAFEVLNTKDLEYPIYNKTPKISHFLRTLSSYTKSAYNDTDPISISRLELSWEMISSYLKVKKWTKKLKNYDTLTVYYEEITNGKEVNKMPQKTSDKICSFLKVKKYPLKTSMKKVNPPNYEKYIINWNSIKNLLPQVRKRYKKAISL